MVFIEDNIPYGLYVFNVVLQTTTCFI